MSITRSTSAKCGRSWPITPPLPGGQRRVPAGLPGRSVTPRSSQRSCLDLRPDRAPARATSPRPSASPSFSRATASSIAKPGLLEELADAQLEGTRKAYLAHVTTIPLLIIDDLGMRKLPQTAAEDPLEIIMRRDERASTLITSNRPVEDWGKLLGDTAAVAAFLDRLLHHAHVLTCGPRSWRTRLHGERGEA
ncbi:MAG TPA: ATP-binding protein [Methylomirabilota bacterium]|nr:ATP-binding protein [Methylomirabilota bacterium]